VNQTIALVVLAVIGGVPLYALIAGWTARCMIQQKWSHWPGPPTHAGAPCPFRSGGELRNLPPAHVHPTHVHVGPWGEWSPKGYPRVKRGVRDVPVHPERLRPLLEEHREEWAGKVTFFVNPRTGEPWEAGAFREQFYRDATAAGLKTGSSGDAVTPHTCRHTFASWLARQDVQLIKIARLLGDTVDMTERYYSHLLPSDLDATVLRLFAGPAQPIDPQSNGKRRKTRATSENHA
jgi:hypothetical protein